MIHGLYKVSCEKFKKKFSELYVTCEKYFAQGYRRPTRQEINSNKPSPTQNTKIVLANQWTIKLEPCVSDHQTLLAFCIVTYEKFNSSYVL